VKIFERFYGQTKFGWRWLTAATEILKKQVHQKNRQKNRMLAATNYKKYAAGQFFKQKNHRPNKNDRFPGLPDFSW
jgi:hypothetical protein